MQAIATYSDRTEYYTNGILTLTIYKQMRILSTNAATYNEDGYMQQTGLTVIDHGETLTIGNSGEISKNDLIIIGGLITSKVSTWQVTL